MSRASNLLKERAYFFKKVRAFFEKRGILEVDTPVLSKTAPVDAHIDVMTVVFQTGQKAYLHTSPEYALKRLLSAGVGDIYQMSHVFREGEWGSLHNPEFTLVEWYRVGMPYDLFIEETLSFIALFLPFLTPTYISYRDAFKTYVGLDYLTASEADLFRVARAHSSALPPTADTWDKNTLLDFILGFIIGAHFQTLTVLKDYPADQAALAQTLWRQEEQIAERFEIYYKGVELANGFHELTDAQEQRLRFETANQERLKLGKETLPLDEHFLHAVEKLPDCCGVAVGFDRLMLLRAGKEKLADVLPFSWGEV